MKTLTTSCAGCTTDTLIFRKVNKEDIPVLQEYFNLYPSRSCDFSTGGLMMWVDYFDYMVSEAYDSLLISGRIPGSGTYLFYVPCGPLKPEEYMCIVSDYCESHGIDGILLIPEAHGADADRDLSINSAGYVREWREYLYDIDRFTGFSGRKMEKKRNHLNFFLNNYPAFQVKEITPSDAADLIAFTLAFGAEHADSELASYEIGQVLDVLRDYNTYSFYGIAISIDGRIAGYTFGEKTGDVFFVHVEKGDISIRGIYQALASRLAAAVKKRFPGVRYLNREEDMGDESLRNSKESYHPCMYVDKKMIRLPLTAR